MPDADGFDRPIELEAEDARPDGALDQPRAAAECPVDFPFDEAGAGRLSNSEAVIEAIFKEASRKLRSASGKSFDALKAHAEVGQGLCELKRHLGRGEFGREVEARLGMTRQWRARVMRVGQEWPDIAAAIEWAKANDRLPRSEYSVDGALALLKVWRRELNGDDTAPASRKAGKTRFACRSCEPAQSLWAEPGANFICGNCNTPMLPLPAGGALRSAS